MSLKILQLCHKPPLPAIDGGCIAMNNITKGLMKEGYEVNILTVETQKHPFLPDLMPEDYRQKTKIESVYVDTSVNLVDAFSALVTSDSYNISRFFSPDFDLKLIKTLRENSYDVIHLESLFMTPYIATIRRHSKGKIVLRSHNLEYIIWERMAEASKNRAKKAYLNLLSRQLKRYELNVINQVDGIAAISNEDAKKYLSFKCFKPIVNIPFGINYNNYTISHTPPEFLSLFHIGAMDWTPNVEGINWFLNKVWPEIRLHQPEIKFYLAGRKMPEYLVKNAPENVIVTGEVESANDFINSKSIMVVPLLTAGGIRVKIIEAMALGKTVISTKIGAEGIDYKKGEHLFIANTPGEFAETINTLVNNRALVEETGKNARKLVENKYDNKLLTRDLINFYHSLTD
ncbi:MAG: glycosyltransferase family 4 protein [Bacteroidota bacterium]